MVIGLMIFIFGLWVGFLAVLVYSVISRVASRDRKRSKERLGLGGSGSKMVLQREQFSG